MCLTFRVKKYYLANKHGYCRLWDGWCQINGREEGNIRHPNSEKLSEIIPGKGASSPPPDFMKIYEFFAIDTQAKIASVVLDSVLDLRATPGGISLVLGVRGPASAQ